MTVPAPGPASGPARLRVRVAFWRPELRAAELPVQVRSPAMVVVATGSTGQEITVAPGEYVVAVSVPRAAELSRRVTVRRGERLDIELTPDSAARDYFGSTEPDRNKLVLAELHADPPGTDAAVRHRTVYLMLLAGNPLTPPLRPVAATRIEFPGPGGELLPWRDVPLIGPPTGLRWLAPDRCELRLLAPTSPGTGLWLRVTAPPDRARVVAVPAGPGESCTAVVTLVSGHRTAGVEFHLPDATLDAFLQYRATADVGAARAMLTGDAAGRAATSPVTRALLAYTALRWGGERYDTGPLTDSDLPDTWIVEAERSVLAGEHVRALGLFELALRAGLPVFSDGLGLLSTRLPQYLRLMTAGMLPDSTTLRDDWARLMPLLVSADLKPVSLTLRSDVRVRRGVSDD